MDKTIIIKQLINNTGLNLKTFSEKAGLPYTTLRSMLERGIDNASITNVIKVCNALNISVDHLIENEQFKLPSLLEQDLIGYFSKLEEESQKLLVIVAKELLKTQNKLLSKEDK